MQPVVVIEKVSVPMVSCVSMLAERRELGTAGDDKLIKIWNSDDGRLVRSYEAHRGTVTSLTWIPHLRFLASTSLDHTLALWNFKGECVTRSKFPTALYSSGFSQKHDTLVVGGLGKMYIIQVSWVKAMPCLADYPNTNIVRPDHPRPFPQCSGQLTFTTLFPKTPTSEHPKPHPGKKTPSP